MVLYFSGTGNSRYAAELISKITGDELVSINGLIKTKSKAAHKSEKPFVFVCPVYAGRIPRVVEKYIRETEFEGTNKAYFVVTCAETPWITASYTEKLCAEKKFDLLGFNSVTMPQGYVAMGGTKPPDESKKILDEATPKIKKIAELIAGAQPLKKEAPGKSTMSKMLNPIMYKFMVNAKGFSVTDGCTGCGKCVERCPLNNVKLVNKKPQWGKECTHCMACIAGCPNKAVEYGKKTKGVPRYYNTQEPQV